VNRTPYKILLLGEHCDDVYHYGHCNRLSPEAPVPVFLQHHREIRAGMASNVRLNLEAMGANVTHYKNTEHIEKHRLYDTKFNHHIIRFDVGENKRASSLLFNDIQDTDFDAVVISDYDKGFITQEIAKKICKKFSHKKIFVDSKKTDLSCFENSIIKVNEDEYNAITNKPRNSSFIVTLGSSGARYNSKIYPTKETEVYDVCGAGDVFLAALVFNFLLTDNIERSIKIANKAATISVTRSGTYVLQKEDIEKIF